jgi:hypothetical protein
MESETTFKSGKDLRAVPFHGPITAIVCECCGKREDEAIAADLGWQKRPPVCPDCLRWSASTAVSQMSSDVQVVRRGRYWAVIEHGALLCVTVYRRGARAVEARLAELKRGGGRGAD